MPGVLECPTLPCRLAQSGLIVILAVTDHCIIPLETEVTQWNNPRPVESAIT
jgi:hypothetical protein